MKERHRNDAHANGPMAYISTVEHSKLLPWLMLCCILAGFAVAFSAFTFYQLTRTEREYNTMRIMVMDQNALLIREGLKLPSDTVYGPAGNLEYGGPTDGRNSLSNSAKRNSSVQRGADKPQGTR
jgi:hypothetical protein